MIAFDLDDALVDTHTHLRKELKKRLNYDANRPDKWIVIPNIPEEEIKKQIREALADITKTMLEPKPGVVRTLAQIRRSTKKPIHIVTARQEIIREVTENWCKKNFGDDTIISFVDNPDKTNYLVKIGTHFWVDDRPDVVLECSKVMHLVFLIDAPWNHKLEPLPANVFRIKDFRHQSILQLMQNKVAQL